MIGTLIMMNGERRNDGLASGQAGRTKRGVEVRTIDAGHDGATICCQKIVGKASGGNTMYLGTPAKYWN